MLAGRDGHACSALLLLLLLLLLFQGLGKRTEERDRKEIHNILRHYQRTMQTVCFTAIGSWILILTTSEVQKDFPQAVCSRGTRTLPVSAHGYTQPHAAASRTGLGWKGPHRAPAPCHGGSPTSASKAKANGCRTPPAVSFHEKKEKAKRKDSRS